MPKPRYSEEAEMYKSDRAPAKLIWRPGKLVVLPPKEHAPASQEELAKCNAMMRTIENQISEMMKNGSNHRY